MPPSSPDPALDAARDPALGAAPDGAPAADRPERVGRDRFVTA